MDAFYNIVELLLLLYYTSFVTWKIFAGHRFSTHFLGGQFVPFQLFLRDLKNKAVHLKFGSNVLCEMFFVLCQMFFVACHNCSLLEVFCRKTLQKHFGADSLQLYLNRLLHRICSVNFAKGFRIAILQNSTGLLVFLSQLPEAHTYILGNQIFFAYTPSQYITQINIAKKQK